MTGNINRDLSSFEREGRPCTNLKSFLNTVEHNHFVHCSSTGADLKIKFRRDRNIRHIDRNLTTDIGSETSRIDRNDTFSVYESESTITKACVDLGCAGNDIAFSVLLEEEVTCKALSIH